MGLFFKNADECFDLGKKNFEESNFEEALKWFKKASKKKKNNLDYRHWLATCLIQCNELNKGFLMLVRNSVAKCELSIEATCELLKFRPKDSFNEANYLIAINIIENSGNYQHPDIYFIHGMLKIRNRDLNNGIKLIKTGANKGSKHSKNYLKAKEQSEKGKSKAWYENEFLKAAGKYAIGGLVFAFTGQWVGD